MKKNTWINALVVLMVLIIALVILLHSSSTPKTSEELAKCIGERSTVYVQLGCPHCADQERMFGDYAHYLNEIDCFYERDKCTGIKGTPTWVIDGKMYEGTKSIKTLANLTGCQ